MLQEDCPFCTLHLTVSYRPSGPNGRPKLPTATALRIRQMVLHTPYLLHAPWTVCDDAKHPASSGTTFNIGIIHVARSPRYASMLGRGDDKRCTDVGGYRLRFSPCLLATALNLLDRRRRQKYLLHPAPVLTWVNVAHPTMPIYCLGKKILHASAIDCDDVNYPWKVPGHPKCCAPRQAQTHPERCESRSLWTRYI